MPSSKLVMESKERSGSERAQPDSSGYLAIERERQDALSAHPKGMALPAPRCVEALDRAVRPALLTSPSATSGRSHVTNLLKGILDPKAPAQ